MAEETLIHAARRMVRNFNIDAECGLISKNSEMAASQLTAAIRHAEYMERKIEADRLAQMSIEGRSDEKGI